MKKWLDRLVSAARDLIADGEGEATACPRVTGRCLCGKVRYVVQAGPRTMTHCHCSMCRRHHGAAFATFMGVEAECFRVTRGKKHLARIRLPRFRSVERTFCAACGSSLTWLEDDCPETVWVTAGTLDADPGCVPESHIWVTSKAPWYRITDDLPQCAKGPLA